MGTFSPYFSGTPSYSSSFSNYGSVGRSKLGSMSSGERNSFKNYISDEVEMPNRSKTVFVPRSDNKSNVKQANNQGDSTMNYAKKAAQLFKKLMNKPTNITGTGPSTPGYSMGMDLSGEAAIEAADLAEAIGLADMTADGALVAADLGAELGTGIAAGEGAAETTLAAEAMAGSTELAAGAEMTGESIAAIEAGAAGAEAGISSTGVGAIIAAAIAAIMALESSGNYEGIRELDRQIYENIDAIGEGDVATVGKGLITNPVNFVAAAERTIGNVFGFDPTRIMPANLITSGFNKYFG